DETVGTDLAADPQEPATRGTGLATELLDGDPVGNHCCRSFEATGGLAVAPAAEFGVRSATPGAPGAGDDRYEEEPTSVRAGHDRPEPDGRAGIATGDDTDDDAHRIGSCASATARSRARTEFFRPVKKYQTRTREVQMTKTMMVTGRRSLMIHRQPTIERIGMTG